MDCITSGVSKLQACLIITEYTKFTVSLIIAAREKGTIQLHCQETGTLEQQVVTTQPECQECEGTDTHVPIPLPPTVQIIGDNVDLRQNPSHQTLDRRGKDHHWFHMVAVKDRVVAGDISVTEPTALVKDLQLHTFLPTIQDCIKHNDEFIILVARILTDHFPAWKCLQESVPSHIPHKFSREMAMKSDIVYTCIHMH